jgi:hypothetical protein
MFNRIPMQTSIADGDDFLMLSAPLDRHPNWGAKFAERKINKFLDWLF